MTLTLAMPLSAWALCAASIVIGGKVLQQGGRSYSEGRRWEFETLFGALLELGPMCYIAFMLLVQNSG